MENASKASIILRNKAPLISAKSAGSAREILEFIALQGICKNFTAEITEEYAKFAKLFFEALCLIEKAKINDSVLQHLSQCC